jgi:hypothetical protein
MNDDLLKVLLRRGESDSIDFKRCPYRIDEGSAQERLTAKSELVKDVLAFANSWCNEEAYILFGVDASKEQGTRVVGIDRQLDDAILQQIVNAKTNRPIKFAYEQATFEGRAMGAIRIPRQQRPFYLKSNFGNLEAQKVYVRRGSSTAIASPDEIRDMGSVFTLPEPRISLKFELRQRNGDLQLAENVISVIAIEYPPPTGLGVPDYYTNHEYEEALDPVLQTASPTALSQLVNRDYYRDLLLFEHERGLLTPIYVVVTNTGNASATDVRIDLIFDDRERQLLVFDDWHLTKEPVRVRSPVHREPQPHVVNHDAQADIIRAQFAGREWRVQACFSKVQPKATESTIHPFHLGASAPFDGFCTARIHADNLPEPMSQIWTVRVAVSQEPWPADIQESLEYAKVFAKVASRRY